MRRNSVSRKVLKLLLIGLFAAAIGSSIAKGADSPTPLSGEVLVPPDVPVGTPGGSPPGYYETTEYLIGTVAVGIVFLESNGTYEPSTENWTAAEESMVVSKITAGLDWLKNENPSATVDFVYDVNYRVPTGYEPINHEGPGDEYLWISEAMAYLGYLGIDHLTQVRDYVNALRETFGTDWGFAVFVVDSSNDPDGCFTGWVDGGWRYSAYAYLGGPFFVMTYDNDGWGIGRMDAVTAHETGHIFYATDEYNGVTEISGYLGIHDHEHSGCIMDVNAWCFSTESRFQLGWRDLDGDGIQDIIDTVPNTTLNPYVPDPTSAAVLRYTGSVVEVPYPNQNPYGTGRNVTINTITNVEFRVDGSAWRNATPTDGAFDEDAEDFMFMIDAHAGTLTIETRGVNSVGNVETTYARDTVTVTIPTMPARVGGNATPIVISGNNLALLAPCIGLTILLAVGAVTILYVMKQRDTSASKR